MAVITFELIHKDAATGARAGILHTPHGKFLKKSSNRDEEP